MTGREVIANCGSCGHTGDCGCSCCAAGPGWRAPSQPLRATKRRRVHPHLASARAYWRLSAKADRAGQYAQAAQYTRMGDSRFAAYKRATAPRPAPAQLRPASDLPAAVVAMYSRVMAEWGYTSPPPVTVDDARRVLARHQPART